MSIPALSKPLCLNAAYPRLTPEQEPSQSEKEGRHQETTQMTKDIEDEAAKQEQGATMIDEGPEAARTGQDGVKKAEEGEQTGLGVVAMLPR